MVPLAQYLIDLVQLIYSLYFQVEFAYSEYQFYKATQAITTFANTDLSAFYLDIAKDR